MQFSPRDVPAIPQNRINTLPTCNIKTDSTKKETQVANKVEHKVRHKKMGQVQQSEGKIRKVQQCCANRVIGNPEDWVRL